MKKIILFTLVLCLVMAFAGAAPVIEPAALGGENQNRGVNTSTTFKVKNQDNATYTGLSISSSAGSAYKVAFSGLPATLASGAEAIVTVSGFVPLSLDAVNRDTGKVLIHNIGTITVSGTLNSESVSTQSALTMQAENKLEIKKLYVNEDSVNDGDEVDELKPEDNIEVRMIVESSFDSDGDCNVDGEDCDIQDIEANLQVDDGEMDVDEDFDISDLGAEDEEEDTVTFEIDQDADDDSYRMEVYAIGQDDNGAYHGEYLEVDLTVERQRDEVSIIDSTFNPNTLECDDRFISISVELENTGRDDQDRVTVDLESKTLDILESISGITLDEGDNIKKNFELKLPSDIKPGTYYFDLIAFNDNDDETDRVTQKIIVQNCESTTPDTKDNEDDKEETVKDNKTNTDVKYVDYTPTSGNVIYGEPKKEETSTDMTYILVLGIGIVLIIILIMILFAVLFKK
ncbi:MAG: hypothetical protein V1859_09625 [archaeon]